MKGWARGEGGDTARKACWVYAERAGDEEEGEEEEGEKGRRESEREREGEWTEIK